MTGRILIIDDEQLFREDTASLLRQEGHVCDTAGSGEAGVALADREAFDVVLTDLIMPGTMSGLDVIDHLSRTAPATAVLLVTAFGELDNAVSAFRKGATDYLLKPVIPEDLLAKVTSCLAHRRLQEEVRYLRRSLDDARTGVTLIGDSQAIADLRQLIARIARTDSTVLVTGESGTGKELVARLIHESSECADGPFVAVNCAALPHELMESELFGHLRGAFTGAVRDKPGLFELASGGTILLDEIGELPSGLQAKLLRAIERKEFLKVGGVRPVRYAARIISATNRSLDDEVAAGRFREDLYYRVRVIDIHVPPLRDRRQDIPELAEHILRRHSSRLKRRIRALDPAAMGALAAAPWPGNVRELENVLERAIILTDSDVIRKRDLPADIAGDSDATAESHDLRKAVRGFELQHIRRVLAETNGSRDEAARRLGVNPSTLYRRLRDLES